MTISLKNLLPPAARIGACILAAASLAAGLSACVPMMLGGAAVGAIMVADRRTSGAQLDDEGIELRIGNRLREALGERAHINVTSYNRQVLLSGEASTAQGKEMAEQIASRVDNVRSVVNEIVVAGNSSLQQRSSDALITGKVKASLVDARDLHASAFKVVTERGTVYLMGRVTQREADRATQIARSIGGVQRVVRIFELLTEEELQRLSTK